jgi:hypothetical protein
MEGAALEAPLFTVQLGRSLEQTWMTMWASPAVGKTDNYVDDIDDLSIYPFSFLFR